MKTRCNTRIACAVLLGTLVACSQQPKVAQPFGLQYPETQQELEGQAPESADAPTVPTQRTSFPSIDAYKSDAAAHILRYNADYTFSGKLPPMLPAIVVLRITVDDTGRITNVWVQRSRDDDASRVAVASMRRTGVLPRPFNLASGPGRSLSYSETFLFNADYRFQIRTLAPVQYGE